MNEQQGKRSQDQQPSAAVVGGVGGDFSTVDCGVENQALVLFRLAGQRNARARVAEERVILGGVVWFAQLSQREKPRPGWVPPGRQPCACGRAGCRPASRRLAAGRGLSISLARRSVRQASPCNYAHRHGHGWYQRTKLLRDAGGMTVTQNLTSSVVDGLLGEGNPLGCCQASGCGGDDRGIAVRAGRQLRP